eukprot:c2036_g1_i1 orf=410-1747(-)
MSSSKLATAATAASLACFLATILCRHYWRRCITIQKNTSTTTTKGRRRGGVLEAIGNTPLIRIHSLSAATGCEILGKAEFLSPGGSVKDRVAVQIIEEALQSGKLRVGGLVTEGSAGSTAISLAMVASAYGCQCHVVIPDDAAIEKAQILEALGAVVERVRPVSISHKDHFVNIARRRAALAESSYRKQLCGNNEDGLKNGTVPPLVDLDVENLCTSSGENDAAISSPASSTQCEDFSQGGYFADQFENLANFRAHYEGTGPEIWAQTGGKLHAFVAAAGTGGTIAGVSRFLKEKDKGIKCFLIDPPGSALFNRVMRGVMYTREEAEGKRLRNPFDTITEGIGINRLTQNFKLALLDGAFQGTDREAVEMARFLVTKEGLFLGSSSAMNCVGAYRVAQMLGPGHTIVTILCDSGLRHLSKFYNTEYLAKLNLTPTANDLEFLDTK